jgi:biopolymer transport protein ExbD
MRRSVYSDHESYDEINVTSMLDLAWVLLIVFMIAVTASVQGIKVNLPKASNTPSLAKPHTKAISIMSDGSLYLDAYPVTLELLESTLRQYKAVDPELPVVVKGDAAVQYQSVMAVLDMLQRLEIHQLGLVTSRLVK